MLLAVLALSCTDSPPTCPPEERPTTILLRATDIGVTDLFLRITIADTSSYDTLMLSVDGRSLRLPFQSVDTLVYLDSLLPKRTYRLEASLFRDTVNVAFSNRLSVTTMDTTTHDFTWHVDTLGGGGNSVLFDVAIVNDSLIYAVGELYKRDSTGQFETTPYSLAVWNGATWQYVRVFYRNQSGGLSIIAPVRGIYIPAPGTIWLATGSVYRWDGASIEAEFSFSRLTLPDPFATVTRVWGSGNTNLFGVGSRGTLVHYDGTSWSQMPSGTDVDLLDVWGSADGNTVWTCGWEDFKPTILLRLTSQSGVWNTVWSEQTPAALREDSLSGILTSIWSGDNLRLHIASTHGLYKITAQTKGEANRSSFAGGQFLPGFPFRVRGTDNNDMAMIGEYSMIAHYNGYSWRHYQQFMNPDGRLRSVATNQNMIVAVGWLYDPLDRRGIVYRGER